MVLVQKELYAAYIGEYKGDVYSIDLSNSSTSAIIAAWWNYRGGTPSFNANWAYLASSWKIWIYKNVNLANAKKVTIKSYWRFVPSADESLWFQSSSQSNYYYWYKGKMISDIKVVYNDSARASSWGSVTTSSYNNTFEVDFTTGATTYTAWTLSASYTMTSSEISTVKWWTYIGAWFEAYSSSVWTNWNIIKNIEITILS